MPASVALKPAEHGAADGRLFFGRSRKAPGAPQIAVAVWIVDGNGDRHALIV
jgi:hypothetical protein